MRNNQLAGEFSSITVMELNVWIKVLKEEGMSKDQMLSELELIDDLLTLQKNKLILNTAFTQTEKKFRRKNVKIFQDVISGRIGKFINDNHDNLT